VNRTIVHTGFARRVAALLVLCALGVAQSRAWVCPMGAGAADPARAAASNAHHHAHVHGAPAGAAVAVADGAVTLAEAGTPGAPAPLDAGCASTMSCAPGMPAPGAGWTAALAGSGTAGDSPLPVAAAVALTKDTPPPRLPA
jgi:hypothetical protein